MDPITHTMTGAAISRAGLDRTTPLAAATLMLAANAPDIDVFVYAVGDAYDGLAFRRGWTHGPLAWVLLPLALTALMLAWDRWVRRRRAPDVPPARARPILYLSVLGVLTHPVLDWMNTYGIRLLMPFSDRWFYGDALFIIDPWVWLALGGPLFLAYSSTRTAILGWALLAAASSLLVLMGPVPVIAKALWCAVIVALIALRTRGRVDVTRAVRAGVVFVTAYTALNVMADVIATARVRRVAEAAGLAVERVMVAPLPANPFTGEVVVATPDAYHLGTFRWLAGAALELDSNPIPVVPEGMGAIVAAAAEDEHARDYLTWSRFPFYRVTETTDGYTVRIGDARYPFEQRGGGLAGITVHVPR